MTEARNTFVLRLSQETRGLVADLYRKDNCRSQNEFIESAIRFYAAYLAARDSAEFLTPVLAAAVCGRLDSSDDRISSLLFKLAVEVSMMTHVLASGLEITDEELRRLRGRCVEEVKRTKGRITFDDAVKFQKGI